jgi:tetratricopeptide (TPR) repeat protein
MMASPRIFWVLPVGVFLLGAWWTPSPEDLVREGNAAFLGGAYGSALDCYTQAEEKTTDPGLVARNKAAVLYKQGNYRAAELLYRCSLSDAPEPRRTQVLYELANSLVRQGADRNVAALEEAIGLYEECLERSDLDATWAMDIRHNLELAKLLWVQATSRPKKSQNEASNDQDSPTPPPPDPRRGNQTPGDASASPGAPDSQGDRVPVQADAARQPAPSNQTPAPGSGNLPPVPDSAELAPMTPEDAAAHLQQAAARIVRERQQHRQSMAKPPAPGVKDW